MPLGKKIGASLITGAATLRRSTISTYQFSGLAVKLTFQMTNNLPFHIINLIGVI